MQQILAHVAKLDTDHTVTLDPCVKIATILDINGVPIYASATHVDLLGYHPFQFKSCGLLNIIHSDDQEDVRAHCIRMLAQNERFACDARMKCSDGNYIEMRLKGYPLTENSRPTGYLLASSVKNSVDLTSVFGARNGRRVPKRSHHPIPLP